MSPLSLRSTRQAATGAEKAPEPEEDDDEPEQGAEE